MCRRRTPVPSIRRGRLTARRSPSTPLFPLASPSSPSRPGAGARRSCRSGSETSTAIRPTRQTGRRSPSTRTRATGPDRPRDLHRERRRKQRPPPDDRNRHKAGLRYRVPVVARRDDDRLHAGEERPPGGIFTVRIDGSGLKRLTPTGSTRLAPTGRRTARPSSTTPTGIHQAASRPGFSRSAACGGHATALTHDRGGPHSFAYSASFRPSWAPNGKRIVFTHTHFKGNNGGVALTTMKPNGTGRKRITDLPVKRSLESPDWGTAP